MSSETQTFIKPTIAITIFTMTIVVLASIEFLKTL
jgi:hypothetical protein